MNLVIFIKNLFHMCNAKGCKRKSTGKTYCCDGAYHLNTCDECRAEWYRLFPNNKR